MSLWDKQFSADHTLDELTSHIKEIRAELSGVTPLSNEQLIQAGTHVGRMLGHLYSYGFRRDRSGDDESLVALNNAWRDMSALCVTLSIVSPKAEAPLPKDPANQRMLHVHISGSPGAGRLHMAGLILRVLGEVGRLTQSDRAAPLLGTAGFMDGAYTALIRPKFDKSLKDIFINDNPDLAFPGTDWVAITTSEETPVWVEHPSPMTIEDFHHRGACIDAATVDHPIRAKDPYASL